MTHRVPLCLCVWTAALAVLAAVPCDAGERYALVVSGASGGPQYAQRYREWRESFATTLREKFAYPQDHVIVLGEDEGPGVGKATRENVRMSFDSFRRRAAKDDVVVVLLIGHGVAEGEEAKFNLVGPDLSATDWASLVKPIAARVVFIDTTSGSFPFLAKISGPGRIVLTATDSSAQQFETVFPEFFVKAFDDPSADHDKNGKISIWEAFSYASAAVRQWYQQKGQLATERPLLDDTGRGIGREAETPGPDGTIAQVTYVQPDAPIQAPANSELAVLLRRKAELEAELELLKARKPTIPSDEYDANLERVLLDIARIDRQIRTKS